MITLRTSEREEFAVAEEVAKMSQMICHMIEDDFIDGTIPLPNPAGESTASLKEWDKEFLNVDDGTLFDLILAANYLSIQGLLDLTCKKVADKMTGRTPEQIRETFNIKNDYSREEEEEVHREHQWAFE
ncbi:hypothetical protein LUZ63_008419 [Rhynchospora breviuscula]|uniref:SKP1-like protein n=1 Tax=Rhynchospora breviuscula TaxID=2022672 RepID=A0A9Q0CUD7_9POAL|nr:hypothetical protein LUZ63_008419 [Rhynchospora breviuscula]